ncbi:MAG: DUF4258 domain-containing protein [Bacteroidetes bacterium]|nr:DUF4258 domain-containing protein [Bacteroidota bacterium]
MPRFTLSLHAVDQINLRAISVEDVFLTLNHPDKIEEESPDQWVYQKVIESESGKEYLIRVFVNSGKSPNLVKTVYRTSKISKYQ